MSVEPPESLAATVAKDDRLASLKRLRDRIATDIDECASLRDLAALSQRLMDVLKQIDELGSEDAGPKETGLSDFEKRLRERESGAKGSRRSKSG